MIAWEDHERLVYLALTRLGVRQHQPDWDDLAQEGRIALWLATRTFDPAQGSWATYALRGITQAVRNAQQRQDRVARRRGPSLDAPLDAEAPAVALADAIADPGPTPEARAIEQAAQARLTAWLATRTPRDAAVVRGRWEGQRFQALQPPGLTYVSTVKLYQRQVAYLGRTLRQEGWAEA